MFIFEPPGSGIQDSFGKIRISRYRKKYRDIEKYLIIYTRIFGGKIWGSWYSEMNVPYSCFCRYFSLLLRKTWHISLSNQTPCEWIITRKDEHHINQSLITNPWRQVLVETPEHVRQLPESSRALTTEAERNTLAKHLFIKV